MSLPYENATSGERAVQDMQKILRGFGCSSFGQMMDYETGELLVQFKYKGRPVSVKASVNGYAAAWLREHLVGPAPEQGGTGTQGTSNRRSGRLFDSAGLDQGPDHRG